MVNETKPKRGRGWHGNSEGHAAVARRKGRSSAASSNVQSSASYANSTMSTDED